MFGSCKSFSIENQNLRGSCYMLWAEIQSQQGLRENRFFSKICLVTVNGKKEKVSHHSVCFELD